MSIYRRHRRQLRAALVKTEKISALSPGLTTVRGEVFVGVTRAGVDDGPDNVGAVFGLSQPSGVDVRADVPP